jgi:hypothetical protein
VDTSFFIRARSTTGWLGWVLVRCGEALVGVYMNNRVEDTIVFHSAAIVDLIISFCYCTS